MVATFSFLIVVNGWLWLWRVVMKIDVNETKINLHTVRSKRTLDLASLHLVRPFSAMPFVQVFEFKKRGFYFVWAGFSSRQFFNTLRELRPDLQFRLATLTDDEEELLAEEKSKPTNTERKRAAKIAKANKKAK